MTAAWPASRSAAIDRDQGRRLHAGEQMAEEALLGALESRAGGGLGLPVQRASGAGDIGRLHRCIQMVMDDSEGTGISVVDAGLLRHQRVLDQFVFHAIEGERAGGVEAERAQVAGQHLHRRDAAGLDRLDELGASAERKVLAAPQAEPLGVGEVVDRRGAGRRDIDDAGVRQRVLEPQTRAALLRSGNVAAFSLAATGVLHCVRLVENQDSVEVGAQPFDDLPDARNLLATVVGA